MGISKKAFTVCISSKISSVDGLQLIGIAISSIQKKTSVNADYTLTFKLIFGHTIL